MAVPANTVQTFAMNGIEDDFSDTISNITPHEKPFYSACKKGRCYSNDPDWQIDTLVPANKDNAHIQGDDATTDTSGQPATVSNYVQLFDKVGSFSSSARAVRTHGRKDEKTYQMAKKGKELGIDIEAAFVQNNASVAPTGSAEGKTGSLESWLETNVSLGASGAVGGYNATTKVVDAPTDGTQRPLVEGMLKDVLRQCTAAGGEPDLIMTGLYNKQQVSAFPGIAALQNNLTNSNNKVIIQGAADMYRSDFGFHTVRFNRQQRDQTLFVLDTSKFEAKFLQPFGREKLAKNGHSDRFMIFAEVTLCSANEAASGKVADLTTAPA